MQKVITSTLIPLILVLAVIYFFPWKMISWGNLTLNPSETVTVTGYAKSQQENQVARFSAGVSAVNNDKQTAVDDVNTKTQEIIDRVKEFGIPQEDIKTQNISVYQMEEGYGAGEEVRLGAWRVNNTVEIVLKEADKATELSEVLFATGANNVYGPNFSVDDTTAAEKDLLASAIKDAREKAQVMAQASSKQLGDVVSISEGGISNVSPYLRMDSSAIGGGGAPAEPGTTTVSQSVTVTFELK